MASCRDREERRLNTPAFPDSRPRIPSPRDLLHRAWAFSRPLTFVGVAMLLTLAVTLVGILLDPRVITGAPAWLKPAKFAISIAIYCFTLLLLLTFVLGTPAPRGTYRVGHGRRSRRRDGPYLRRGGLRHHQPLQREHAYQRRRVGRYVPLRGAGLGNEPADRRFVASPAPAQPRLRLGLEARGCSSRSWAWA